MKIKNLIIYIVVLAIVLLSFKVPEWILKNEEDNMEMPYYWEQGKSKIDVEAEKIYLVRAIHDIQEGISKVAINADKHGYTVEFNDSERKQIPRAKNLDKELLKLKEYNLLEYPNSIETSNGQYDAMSIIDRTYEVDEKFYTISNIELILEGNMYEIEVEEKSGKIIFISFDKNEIDNTIDRETILRSYVNYLDLHIIDDWKYEDSMLSSEKADLVVGLYQSEKTDIAIISIHANDKYIEFTDSSSNVDGSSKIKTETVFKSDKNWYNFDTIKMQLRYNLNTI